MKKFFTKKQNELTVKESLAFAVVYVAVYMTATAAGAIAVDKLLKHREAKRQEELLRLDIKQI